VLDSRVFTIKSGVLQGKSALYWISREQRIEYNFALLKAAEYAEKNSLTLVVAFCVAPEFLGATPEAFAFMGDGLMELDAAFREKNTPFRLLYGNPPKEIADFAIAIEAEAIFCDFDPLRIKKAWQEELKEAFVGSIYEVDSHNIVPARVVSGKKEFAAYTLRPKINRLLPSFMQPAAIYPMRQAKQTPFENDYSFFKNLPRNSYFKSGRIAATLRLDEFLKTKLDGYAAYRNDPTKDYQSELSVYLHFGQISSLEIAIRVKEANSNEQSKEAFLEELIVRKELADNFCLYCEDYDNEKAAEPWAKANMQITDEEPREYIYCIEEFENAKTHDELWNAAQKELKIKGKIHGYMRMYWAKKILEWTPSAKEAFRVAVSLNDRYALDGRDPNGYAGIAWSICGVHDRAWPPRKIFGKVRYMNYNGCKAKFSIKSYIQNIESLSNGVANRLF